MAQPPLEEAGRLARQGVEVPVFLELLGDVETPVSAYVKLGGGPGSFLLESVEGGEHLGRYSFIGLEPDLSITLRDGHAYISGALENCTLPLGDPLGLLDDLLTRTRVAHVPGLPRFRGGAVGYLSYDVARFFERLPGPAHPGLGLPLAVLGIYRTILAFDHLRRTILLMTHVAPGGDFARGYEKASAALEEMASRLARSIDSDSTPGLRLPGAAGAPTGAGQPANGGSVGRFGAGFTSNFSREEFECAVQKARAYIAAGDAIQVVLSQRLSVPFSGAPLDLYRALRSINPSPYMYFLDYGDFQIVGSSPEMLVRVEGSTVSVRPIAGTRRRGPDPERDGELARDLAADEKERAEHLMLVDLGRNDVGRVSRVGSVRTPRLMDVERYSHVMHLVSQVEGALREGLRPVDALRAGFPAGTVSGAPKVRAMQIIAELEPDARGPYAGAVGYFGFDGTIDTAIAIRTAVIAGGQAHVQVGAGIVADSLPELEYEETLNKAAAMLRAVEAAESMGGEVVAAHR